MEQQEKKEEHLIMDTYIGNCHIRFFDNYILKDKEEIEKQLKCIERIIWDGIPKVPEQYRSTKGIGT